MDFLVEKYNCLNCGKNLEEYEENFCDECNKEYDSYPSNEDLGFCPHGSHSDEDCE